MIPKLYCSECNGELSIYDKYCSVCGAKIEWQDPKAKRDPSSSDFGLMGGQAERSDLTTDSQSAASLLCSLCGFENDPDFRFCENCGASLGISREPLSDEKAASKEQAQRQKQKPAKHLAEKGARPARTPSDPPERRGRGGRKRVGAVAGWLAPRPSNISRRPLQPWKLFSIPVIALLMGLAIYGVTRQEDEEHTHEGFSGAGTSILQEIEQLQTIVDRNPQDSQSLLRLANRLQDARFLPSAITYYKQYLALVPGDANARVDLGICYFETGDARTAISEMEKALNFEPLHQLGHLNLGIVNLNSGSVQKANEWFTKCVEINPNTEAGKRAQRILEQHAVINEPTVQ